MHPPHPTHPIHPNHLIHPIQPICPIYPINPIHPLHPIQPHSPHSPHSPHQLYSHHNSYFKICYPSIIYHRLYSARPLISHTFFPQYTQSYKDTLLLNPQHNYSHNTSQINFSLYFTPQTSQLMSNCSTVFVLNLSIIVPHILQSTH